MATATEAVLELDGFARYDALSQQIEASFVEFHSLLERHKVLLLERVREMRELYQQHRDIKKSLEQMEGMKRAANEMVTENKIAGSKEQMVGLCEDRILQLKREKADLPPVCEFKFLPNADEFRECLNRIHLRNSESAEFSKRREPIVMKGRRGEGEKEMYLPYDVAVDREMNVVFVTDYFKHLILVYSMEGDFIRSFRNENLFLPNAICISEKYVFVTNEYPLSIMKFSKAGDFVCDSKFVNKDIKIESGTGYMCAYNELLYVCNGGRNRIELFNYSLLYIGAFGEEKIKFLNDIKIYNNVIYVFCGFATSIHTFNSKHKFLSTITLKCLPVSVASSDVHLFTIDLNGNFIVTRKNAKSLDVYSQSGEFIDSLGIGYLYLPQAIDVNSQNQIVSISGSHLNCFQIY